MYPEYKTHDDATLSYLNDACRQFHTFKDDFVLGQAGKKAKAEPNSLRTELMKK
jgi:hypothetical protein